MKNVYVVLGLTFLLNFQLSRSMYNLAKSLLRKEESSLSENVRICVTAECKETAHRLNNYMRRDANPCKNFYEFSCGYFSSAHQDVEDPTTKRIHQLNDRILYYLDSDHDHNFQAFRKIQHIFRLCMDEDAIKEFGVNVIQLQLSNIGLPTVPPFHQITSKANNFDRILAKLYRNAGTPFLFAVRVRSDNKDYTKNHPFIDMNIFKLPNDAFRFKEYYKIYVMSVINHLYELGNMEITSEFLDFVSKRADEVLQFFFNIHEVGKKHENLMNFCTFIKMKNLQEGTDEILRNSDINFSWMTYLSTIFKNNNIEDYFHSEPLIVCSMEYIEDIFKIISGVNKEVLEASLWSVVVHNVIDIADEELRSLHTRFFHNTKNILYGREKTCLNFVKDQFNHVITHLLLQEVDLERDIAEINEMTENVRKSFEKTIKNAQWMDKSTRKEAIRKLNKIEVIISHENWIESLEEIENKYADVKLKRSWYMTMRTVTVRSIRNEIKLLFTRNESNEKRFPLNPLTPFAYYNYFYNTVVIPFTYLGLPFIHHGLRCMDYGALAFTIGHEFMHAFTEGGAFADSSGDFKNWWKENTLQKFKKRTQCLVDSYSTFIFNGKVMQNDGYFTLDENIADNVGMKLALDAYDLYVAKHGPEEKLIGFQNLYNSEQLLTIAMATKWCWNAPDNYTGEPQPQEDNHSPLPLRVNGIFMNSDRMANIWKCPKGSPMNPLKEKCYIW